MSLFLKINLFLLILTFLFYQESFILAYNQIVCDEPILIGIAFNELEKLMKKLFRELTSIVKYVWAVEQQLTTTVNKLSGKICDFEKCHPIIGHNISPRLSLAVILPFKSKPKETGLSIQFPACASYCEGIPCPQLKEVKKILEDQIKGIENAYKELEKLISQRIVIVNEDINEFPEEIGEKITQAESIRRYLRLARLDLMPVGRIIDVYSRTDKEKKEMIARQSCVLGIEEKKGLIRGEIKGSRFPLQCLDALERNLYWPRPWSEYCHYECLYGLDNECRKCLMNDKNNRQTASILAKINYAIFKKCDKQCCNYNNDMERCQNKYLTEECIECLCGEGKGQSQECIKWICGGSLINYICCHETPLELNVGLDRVIYVDEFNDLSDYLPKGTIAHTCVEAFPIKPPKKYLTWCNDENEYSTNFKDYFGVSKSFIEKEGVVVEKGPVNADELDEIIGCLKKKAGDVDKDLGSLLTTELKRPVCNYTRGQTICGRCAHGACSCHYGGKTNPYKGVFAVDVGNEKLWDDKDDNKNIQKWLEECQKKWLSEYQQGIEKVVCAIREDTHIHISLPIEGNCDIGLINKYKKGINIVIHETTNQGKKVIKKYPFKCWGLKQ